MKQTWKLVLVTTGTWLFSTYVSAASFYLNEKYASGIGRANSGEAAIADTPNVIASNPAGITRFDGFTLSGNTTLTLQQMEIESLWINQKVVDLVPPLHFLPVFCRFPSLTTCTLALEL
ncbi:hypothetical protein CS022_00515 [Veronia nyctiphanis]|uniref:Long-chain fatty acid transport protein n=1 Tax=Veronia nyctiphanis TaxID=1278244 RepID=A0A4Q0Z020_9GAMM|nr:outer membrane protein transport protein [Veronia nyctiphanis]RXJ74751.1 hypothetical protein CS022_00515 [Veronia nyctiphanis]